MAEIVLDVHDSVWEIELGCTFEVIKPEELLKRELDKFKKEHPELFKKLEADLKKLEENKGG